MLGKYILIDGLFYACPLNLAMFRWETAVCLSLGYASQRNRSRSTGSIASAQTR